jgi:hypothetical protein
LTHIARGPGGYVLPVCDQPWFDGSRTPKELILAWEQASREDWIRFDAYRCKERKAQEKSEAKWTTFFIIAWFLIVLLAVVFR